MEKDEMKAPDIIHFSINKQRNIKKICDKSSLNFFKELCTKGFLYRLFALVYFISFFLLAVPL
jgi:hypothetical protein